MTERKADRIKAPATARLSLGGIGWLGGAVWVAHQPGYNFWDGLIWMYYVGRFVAMHATALT